MNIESTFEHALEHFDRQKLDHANDIIYGVDPDMRLAYFNHAWLEVAHENQAEDSFFDDWGIGSPVDESFGDDLAPFYLQKFEQTRESGEPWSHDYLCPAPAAMIKYRMRILPLDAGGWLVVHSKIVEIPRDPEEGAHSSDTYRDDDGLFHQCSHCARFRRAETPPVWDWVPVLFEDPPQRTSHGLCSTCFDYHYGDAG